MEFQRYLSLPDGERDQLLGWGSDIFDTEDLTLIWRPKQVHLVLYAHGEPVSTCGLLRQLLRVDSRALEVGGIGGVVTPPQHQCQGYARQLLREALRIFAEEWSLDAGMLFCREALVPFYRASNWQQLDPPVRIAQPPGTIECPTPVMVFPLNGQWPVGPVNIDSLPW